MPIAKSFAVGVASLAIAAGASPAFATTTKPTSLTLKAAHASVAPKHHDTLTATLKSGTKALAGKTIWLYERKPGAKTWGKAIAHHTTNLKGQYTFTVTITGTKGQKDQFEVKFLGGSGYAASHSKVISVTVS